MLSFNTGTRGHAPFRTVHAHLNSFCRIHCGFLRKAHAVSVLTPRQHAFVLAYRRRLRPSAGPLTSRLTAGARHHRRPAGCGRQTPAGPPRLTTRAFPRKHKREPRWPFPSPREHRSPATKPPRTREARSGSVRPPRRCGEPGRPRPPGPSARPRALWCFKACRGGVSAFHPGAAHRPGPGTFESAEQRRQLQYLPSGGGGSDGRR